MTENKYKVPAELWARLPEADRVKFNAMVDQAITPMPKFIEQTAFDKKLLDAFAKVLEMSPFKKLREMGSKPAPVQGGNPCWHSGAQRSPLVTRDYSVPVNFTIGPRRRVLIGGPADGAEVFTDNFEWLVAQPLPITSLLKCDDPDCMSKPAYITHRYVARRGDPVRMDYAPPETKGTPA